MNHQPLHPPCAANTGGKSSADTLYDSEDLLRLRRLAVRRQEQARAVLDAFRRARILACEMDCGSVVRTMDQVESYAREAAEEAARKVADFDKDLATATSASRWVMALRPDAPR